MGNVIKLNINDYRGPVPVKTILKSIKKADLEIIMLVGVDKDGDLYLASSTGNNSTNVFLLERGKYELIKMISGE